MRAFAQSEIDVQALRADTPGADEVIHLNNAGASLMPRVVLDAMLGHLEREARIGGYEAAHEAERRIGNVYESIARLVNAHVDEVAVVENATRAWDMAFYSLPFEPGDLVLTTATEYAGNYIPYLQLRQRRGIRIGIVPNDASGQVSLDALRECLADSRAKLVSLPMIATNGGPVQPVKAIGALAREAGVWFLLDACQAVGQIPLDVRAIGCHMLSATSRKYLRGPRGCGFLYIERALAQTLEPVFLDLHAATLRAPERYEIRGDARRFENWECNVAAKLGMGAAIDYALSLGVDLLWQRIHASAKALRERLAALEYVTVRDGGMLRSGIVTFTVDGCAADVVMRTLASGRKRINVSHSTVHSTMLDMQARGLDAVVRASVHAYNTLDEIDEFVYAVKAIARGKSDAI